MEPVCEFHSRFAHVRISDGSIDSRIFNLWVAPTLVSSCALLTYHCSSDSHSHVRRNVYLDILCTARLPAHCSTLLSCRVYRKMLEQLDYCPIMKYSYVSGWFVLQRSSSASLKSLVDTYIPRIKAVVVYVHDKCRFTGGGCKSLFQCLCPRSSNSRGVRHTPSSSASYPSPTTT